MRSKAGRGGVRRLWGVAGLVLAAAPLVAPSTALATVAAASTSNVCTAASPSVRPLSVEVHGETATGLFALPSGPPKGIVVVGHGHTADARSMAGIVQQLAESDGVVALAMDYRGTNLATLFGWRVIEGAQDSIAATQFFDRVCPGSAAFTNVVLGISMGGNMSGLAVSSDARRSDGAPLFDYWFDVSGVTNVAEIYADAQAIAVVPVKGVATTGTTAMAEMQQEFGGSPVSNPLAYLANSPVLRTAAMRSSGLRGVVIAHGVLDGEVTSDMSDQMAVALAAAGIPVDLSTSVFKDTGTASGLTIDGYLSALDSHYQSPFAGHVSQVVLAAALSRLHALYSGGFQPGGTSLDLTDGQVGAHPLVTAPRLPFGPPAS